MSRQGESEAQGRVGGSLSKSDKIAQQWHEAVDQYETTLEEIAKATLDQDFNDEQSAIEQWFRVLSEPERTASMYALMQQTTDIRIDFFIEVLQHMKGLKPNISAGETAVSKGALLLASRKQLEDASKVIKSLQEQNKSLRGDFPTIRRRESMDVLALEQRVEQLTNENRRFARDKAAADGVKAATSEKDKEIEQLRQELEIAKQDLSEANARNNTQKAQPQSQSHSVVVTDEDGKASYVTIPFQGQVVTRSGTYVEQLENERQRVGALEQELQSHQEAIESFQSTLRESSEVIVSVSRGDLSKRITIRPVEMDPEIVNFKRAINTTLNYLQDFISDVSRIVREVGTEGRLGGQAEAIGADGIWNDLAENVNRMAGILTMHVREISEVASSMANGDLTRKMEQPAQGEALVLKETINYMVDRLRTNVMEVTRVARDVGTNGKLGGQAEVEETRGVWNTLTVTVNAMAQNLTDVVRQSAIVTKAVAHGDGTQRIKEQVGGDVLQLQQIDRPARGEILELQRSMNTMINQLQDRSAARSQNEGHDEHAMQELRDALMAEQTLQQNTVALKLDIDALQRKVRDLASERDFLTGELERHAKLKSIKTSTSPFANPPDIPGPWGRDSSDNSAAPSQTAAEERDDEEVMQHSDAPFTEGSPPLGSQSAIQIQQKEQRERLNRIWTILHSTL